MTAAATAAESFAQLDQAMTLWFETALEHGQSIPQPAPLASLDTWRLILLRQFEQVLANRATALSTEPVYRTVVEAWLDGLDATLRHLEGRTPRSAP
jgi:hypothetical protein